MGAVIDVLSAEIPPVDLEILLLVFGLDSQFLPPDLDSVSGWDRTIKGLAPEPAAELRLTDATVAEQDYLDLVLWLGAEFQLGKVGAQARKAVVFKTSREDLPRNSGHLIRKKFF